ncbi:MAG: glycosyltransferase family 9 protein [Pseudobdellovibrionaceae bacterium]|nr:glycosyltransferase family 9 protein [Pseudobdellovibrionaceae bacterium]
MARNILLIQLRQLGDILLTTPSFREMKRAWPDAKITFLSHPMGRLIVDDNPYVHRHITYDPKGGWRQDWKLIQELRAARYDLVLDFMYNPRSALYARATGAPRRLAFPSRRSFFFTEIVPQGDRIEYIVREKFRYLQHLGIQPVSPQLDLPWGESHTGPLLQLLQEAPDFSQAPLRVAISPTHRRAERQWPVERYARIADRLHQEWGASVLWLWGPGEEEFVRQAMAFCEQPMRLAPKTSFRELASLIANCDLFLGNSNGPSHVTVAVDTPSLQLHGPTYAATWCPMTDRHQARQAHAGTPEGRGPITAIGEAEVWETLEHMQALLRKSAESRQRNGVRMGWSPLPFSK